MRFAHTNIAARDWRGLADFYIRVFDCREKPPQRNLSGHWLDRATGLKGAQLEGIHLYLPGYGENGPTLEIFTYTDMVGESIPAANHQGFAHIAFEVDDVREVHARALSQGGQILGEVTEKEVEGVGTLVFVYLKDPEGNILEIQSWDQ